MNYKLRFLLFLFALLASSKLWAATKTWGGSSSGNWATAANWSGGTLPVAGDDLVFPGSVTRLTITNNFSPNRAFNSLTFLGTNYLLRGSPLILTNGIRMGTHGGSGVGAQNVNSIEADIQLQASQTFNVTNLFAKLSISGNVSMLSGCLEVSGDGNTDISGVVSGSCGITKTGFGYLTLFAANTFGGTLGIYDGRVVAENSDSLGDKLGGTILQHGFLELHAAVTNEALILWGGILFNSVDPGRWQGNISVLSNSSIFFNGQFTIDGVIGGSADLALNQNAAVPAWQCTFTGSSANTLTGEVWLQDGRLVLDKSPSLAIAGPLKLGGGSSTNAVVRENQNNQIATMPITLLTNAILDLDGHTDAVGALTLMGGTLTNNGAGVCVINGDINAAYATRRSDIYGNISLGGVTRTFFVTNSDDTTGTELNIHGEIRNSLGLIKAGDGYMGLLASNSYSGLTTISAGTLLVQDDFGLGTTGTGTIVNSGGTLYVASSTIAEPLALNGEGDTIESRSGALRGLLATCSGAITIATDSTINVPSASPFNLTLSGPISGTGGITKTGPGTLLYSGADDNTYSGDTWIKAGILSFNKTSAYAISNSASLIIGDASDGTADDIVRYSSGNQLRTTVNISLNRTGLLDLNGFTDDVGDINMTGGTIDSSSGVLQLRGTLTAIGTSFGLTPYPAVILGNLDLGSSSRTVVVNNDSFAQGIPEDLVIGAAMSGTANWTKTGPGEMFLGTSNSFSGLVTVNDGRLIVTNAFALGATGNGVVLNNGANLELRTGVTIAAEPLTLNTTNAAFGAIYSPSAVNTWNGPISLSNTAVVFPDGTSTIALGGTISGAGGLTKIGSGTLTYSGGSANNYTGVTTVKAGTLLLSKTLANNSILGPLVIGDVSGGANADVVRLQTTSQLGSLVAVTINSSGLFDLNGITETFGSLAGSGNVTLGGATLTAGGDDTSTVFSGVISESGKVTKAGAGAMTLSGANTYTGTTTASAGALLVNGSQPQSSVTVNSSGTLGGIGTVGVITLSGSLAPGKSPGILTTSNLDFTASGDFFVELTGPTAGTDYDQLNVHGTNNLANAVLHVLPVFTKPVSVGQQFTIINNDGTDPITTTFSGLAENSTFAAGGYGFRINYGAGTGNDVMLTLTTVPVDFFFTNVLGGDFLYPSNWFPNAVPGPTNNANFTNSATYTVSWSGSATNANAFFKATNGIVTESIGAFSWLLTNSYVIGPDANTTASVTHASGPLRVTNSAGTATLEVRRGTNRLNGGVIEADRLLLTNTAGWFEFNGGTLITRGGTISNVPPSSFSQQFTVGFSGSTPAIWDLRAGSDHVLPLNLRVGPDVSGSQLLITNGGKLLGRGATVGSGSPSSSGMSNTVLVAGVGSFWSNSIGMTVGSWTGFNQLTISNGGKVAADSLVIGSTSSANSNRVVLSGSGSSFEITDTLFGDLDVGASGSGNLLVISNGATLVSDGTLLFDIGQQLSSSNNIFLMDGAGTLITNAPQRGARLTVGGSGFHNQATFSGGAHAYLEGITLGADNSASRLNTTFVQGAGTFVDCQAGNTTSGVEVGVESSDNTFEVLDGAAVNSHLIVGYDTNAANNTAIVSGPGSVLTNDFFEVAVGYYGPSNLLLISNGGKVSTPEVDMGVGPTATNNRIVVLDSGSLLKQVAGVRSFLVGGSGNSLVASNGATVYPWDFRFGSGNQALVTGPGTLFTNESLFALGGRMVVSNGATLGTRAQTTTGTGLTANGATLTITDTGSSWQCSQNAFSVGVGAANTLLLVTNGALVRAPSFILGYFTGDDGNTLHLTGPGTRLTNIFFGPTLEIGKSGANNRCIIANGARADLFTTGGSELARTVLGNSVTASGNSLLVGGTNSVLVSPTLLIGSNGPNCQLQMTNGGFVANVLASIGVSSVTSNNSAVIGGAGSLWSSSVLFLGSNAPGNSLVVSNGPTVLANTLIIGNNASSSNNSAALINATMKVTNSVATGTLDVRRGSFTFQGGSLVTDRLLLTNGAQCGFTFNAGQADVRSATVANGQTFFVGDGASAATLNLVASGSNFFANGLTIRSNASLIGNGTISGTLTVQFGGAVAPGTSVGKIILNNPPALGGTLIMEISKNGGALINDQIQVSGPLTYGGNLIVSNIGPDALVLGNRFPLFNATAYSGSFANITLPALASGLGWTNKLAGDGSLEVVASTTIRPQFSTFTLSGTNLILSGSGGTSNGSYRVLSSTNVALPITSWLPLATNLFDSSGNFLFTNAVSPSIPQRFYLLQVP